MLINGRFMIEKQLFIRAMRHGHNLGTSTLWPWRMARINNCFSIIKRPLISILPQAASRSLTQTFSGVGAARSSHRRFRRMFTASGGGSRQKIERVVVAGVDRGGAVYAISETIAKVSALSYSATLANFSR